MFGIPEWAVGVAFITLAISIGKALAGRFPHNDNRGRLVPPRPRTVPSDAACGVSR